MIEWNVKIDALIKMMSSQRQEHNCTRDQFGDNISSNCICTQCNDSGSYIADSKCVTRDTTITSN